MNKSLDPLILTNAGRPLFQISLTPNATAVEEYASEELRRHLYEMAGLGTQLRLVAPHTCTIFLNHREAAEKAGIDVVGLKLGREAYHLETKDGNLYLIGGSPRGLLYAVYGLLESLGWRWYTPEIRRVPKQKKIILEALCRTESPAFEFRDMWVWDDHDPLWWSRNRMNGWYTPVPEYMGGHNNYAGFVHTFSLLLSPDEFFGTHPEYFSEIGGLRKKDGVQLCLTNPDVLKIVTAHVIELMKQHPTVTIFSVSQNDNQSYCDCSACHAVAEEEGSQSGLMIRFVNGVAAETSKLFPAKLIDTLAYQYTLDAPRHAIPHPNVRVRICSIGCCQGHGYGTCDHKESMRFMRAFEGWRQRTKQMYVWHYATNFLNYLLPMPDFDELNANLKLYKQLDVHGVFVQGMGEEGGGGESMALRGYVLSKLLWNPDQDVWPLVDEFLQAVYGEAGPKVRDYLNILHERVKADRTLHPSLYDSTGLRLFDEDVMAPADAALAEAEKLAKGEARSKVRLLRSGIAYARLNRIPGNFRVEGDLYKGQAVDSDLKQFDAWVKEWKKMGILRLREGELLEAGIRRVRRSLASHHVEWLKTDKQSIAVIPTMSGRIHEWHAEGRQWLAEPDPLGLSTDGYTEFAMPEGRFLLEAGESYKVGRRGDAVTLTTQLEPTLKLQRFYSFKGEALCIRSRLINGGSGPIQYKWGAGMHLVCPDTAAIVYRDETGEKRIEWDDLSDSLATARVLAGAKRPLERLQIEMNGWQITCSFSTNITSAIIGKVSARHMLAIDVRSDSFELPPGGKIEFLQEWKCLKLNAH